MIKRVETWMIETAVVYSILALVNVLTGADVIGWIFAVGVGAAFGCASISQRMAEAQEARSTPDVHCYRKMQWYWNVKEAAFFTGFALTGNWAAIVGSVVFTTYPYWRKLYRKLRPRRE